MSLSQMSKNQSISKSPISQLNKKTSSIKLSMTQTLINIHDLHQFIRITFNGCMLPDLLQFVQIHIQQEQHQIHDRGKHCKINIQKFKKSIFRNNQDDDFIYFVQSGKVILKVKTKQQNVSQEQLIKRLRANSANKLMSNSKIQDANNLNKQKTIQIKQGNFFIMTNTRKINDPQFYQILGHQNGELGCCLIGKIKINKKYNINWYITQSQKNMFLTPLFQSANQYIHQQKIKGLIKHFHYQKYRRGTILATQGQTNDKIMILKTGECQYSKSIAIQQKNHTSIKIVKIANGQIRAVIGQQLILFDLCGSSKVADIAIKGLHDFQEQVQNQNTKFKVFQKKINNFTIMALSAYVEVYWIQFSKFKQICEKYLPQVPQNIRVNIQSNYVTLMRTTKQKFELQFSKIKLNQSIVKQQRQTLQIKLASGQINYNNNSPQNKVHSPIKLKPSELIQTNLRGQEVQKMRTKRLQKKIQLLLSASNINPFNHKLQIINNQKPQTYSNTQSPNIRKFENLNQNSPVLLQDQNEGEMYEQVIISPEAMISRSNSIKRQSNIIEKKTQLLKNRYSSQNNLLVLDEQMKKSKLFKIDMIKRGFYQIAEKQQQKKLSMKQLSNKIKKDCIQKINKANKIKQQYMTIRSQCQNCHCYDDVQGSKSHRKYLDIKSQTMMTGSAWRISEMPPLKHQQMPLQKLHSTVKMVSEKSKKKYNHNIHLHLKSKALFSTNKRRMSAPIL